MIAFNCPECGDPIGTASSLAGKTTECQHCHKQVTVPAESQTNLVPSPKASGSPREAMGTAFMIPTAIGGVIGGVWGFVMFFQGEIPIFFVALCTVGGFIAGAIVGAVIAPIVGGVTKVSQAVRSRDKTDKAEQERLHHTEKEVGQ